jgi:hypothetical protein
MRSQFLKEFRQLFSILPEAGKVSVFTGWYCMVSIPVTLDLAIVLTFVNACPWA